MEYENLMAEIENLPDYHVIGPLHINMGVLNEFCYRNTLSKRYKIMTIIITLILSLDAQINYFRALKQFNIFANNSIYFIDKLKLAFHVEASAWKKSLGVILSNRYKEKLQNITDYIQEKNKILSRNIKDLEDVRVAMKCLGEIWNDFISLDMELILIEETYTLMGKFNVDISKEEQDVVDGLRYNFSNMLHTVSTRRFCLSLLSIFYILSLY